MIERNVEMYNQIKEETRKQLFNEFEDRIYNLAHNQQIASMFALGLAIIIILTIAIAVIFF